MVKSLVPFAGSEERHEEIGILSPQLVYLAIVKWLCVRCGCFSNFGRSGAPEDPLVRIV